MTTQHTAAAMQGVGDSCCVETPHADATLFPSRTALIFDSIRDSLEEISTRLARTNWYSYDALGLAAEACGSCKGLLPDIGERVDEVDRRVKQAIALLRAIDPKQSCLGEGAAESWQFCVEHALEVLEGRAG